jgi:tyrosyl-tRNA synthetase
MLHAATLRHGNSMTQPRSEFLHRLVTRGFIHQCTDLEGLDELARKGQIMMLRWLQKTGHKPIALMGGGTTKVGDPVRQGRARKLLTVDQIDGQHRGHQARCSRSS